MIVINNYGITLKEIDLNLFIPRNKRRERERERKE